MRAVRIGLIVLVVLGGLLVAADRVAVRLAESEVAAKTRSGLDLDEEPGVSVKGFPFLNQMLAKKLGRVDLELETYQVQLDDQLGTVEDLTIQLHDVRLENGYSRAVAERATGEGIISYAEMARLTADGDSAFGVAFAYAGDGQVELRITVMGRALGPSMVGDISVEGDLVRFDVEDIPSFKEIPVIGTIDGIEAQVRDRLDRDRQVTGLPSGVELSGMTATEDGVVLSLRGDDVSLNGG
jgi:hypothetical protein